MSNRIAWMAAGVMGMVGLVASPAAAAGDGGWSVSIGHGSSCSASHASAGVLWIDGCATTIRGSSPGWEMVRAFHRAGYHASVEHGAVVVRFGHRRPEVRWRGESHDARFSWSHGCLTVRTVRIACGLCSSCGPKGKSGVCIDIGHDGRSSRGRGRDRDRRQSCPPPRRGRGRH